MAIEWNSPTGGYLASDDNMYVINFLVFQMGLDKPTPFYTLFINKIDMFHGTLEDCIDKAEELEIKNMSATDKFAEYLDEMGDMHDSRAGHPFSGFSWVNKSGDRIHITKEELQEVLTMAKRYQEGIKHE